MSGHAEQLLPIPDTGSLRSDLVEFVARLVDMLLEGLMP